MTDVQNPPPPDTTDMRAVHAVFRQALAAVPTLVQGAPDGDVARAALVASYYDNVLRFLNVHHGAEDALVWPKLSERCPTNRDLVEQMMSSHEDVHGAAEGAAECVAAWAASADAEAGSRLAAALTELGEILVPHLDEEEQKILPLCTQYVTIEEWGQMPGHAMARYDGDKLWLILGLIRQNMTPAQRDAMLEHMPPPPREMWITTGSNAFNAFMAQLGLAGR